MKKKVLFLAKSTFFCKIICVCHFFCVILQRKMNRAPVAKKVLLYLPTLREYVFRAGEYRTY